MDLGAGITGKFDADGVAEHFTGEGGTIDAALAAAAHAVRNTAPLFVYCQDFVYIWGLRSFRFNNGFHHGNFDLARDLGLGCRGTTHHSERDQQ